MTSSQSNSEKEVSESVASSIEPTEEKNNTDNEMKQLMANVRQNFGRINVAPQFSEEDLIPVDMPGFDETDSDCPEEGEQEEEEEEENEQHQDSVEEESQPTVPSARESSKAVLQALEEKIAKCKKFLDKAKAKRFSAIRYLNLFGDSSVFPGEGGKEMICFCRSFTPCMSHCHGFSS